MGFVHIKYSCRHCSIFICLCSWQSSLCLIVFWLNITTFCNTCVHWSVWLVGCFLLVLSAARVVINSFLLTLCSLKCFFFLNKEWYIVALINIHHYYCSLVSFLFWHFCCLVGWYVYVLWVCLWCILTGLLAFWDTVFNTWIFSLFVVSLVTTAASYFSAKMTLILHCFVYIYFMSGFKIINWITHILTTGSYKFYW